MRDWPGPARPDDADDAVPGRVAARGARRGRDRRRATDAARAARAGGARAVRGARRRAAPARRAPAASARARTPRTAPRDRWRGAPCRSAALHRLRAVPEALLLDGRPAPAAVQRTRGAHRHRGPPVDRAAGDRPGGAARGRRDAATSPARSWPASPARSSACARRSWAAGSPTSPRSTPSAPFLLRLGGFTVGGRIDAIYGEPDGAVGGGGLEDRSSPRRRRPTRGLQLDLYGLACVEIWDKRARGRHAHLLLPGERRGGVASDGGSRGA